MDNYHSDQDTDEEFPETNWRQAPLPVIQQRRRRRRVDILNHAFSAMLDGEPLTPLERRIVEQDFEQYRRYQEQNRSCARRTCDYITDYIKDLFVRFRPYPFFRGGKKIKTRRKLRKRKKKTKRKKKRKRKKGTRRRKRKSRRKKGGKKLDGIECWDASEWTPCREKDARIFNFIKQNRNILNINIVDKMPDDMNFMYVMECAQGGLKGDGNIWIFPDEIISLFNKSGNHPCLIDNKPVQAAGLISKNKNKITIDACSGHYRPSWQVALKNIYEYLQNNYIIETENAVFNKESEACDEESAMVTFTLNKAIFNSNGKFIESGEEKRGVSETKPSFQLVGKEERGVAAPAPANLTVQTQGEERGPTIRVESDDSAMSID